MPSFVRTIPFCWVYRASSPSTGLVRIVTMNFIFLRSRYWPSSIPFYNYTGTHPSIRPCDLSSTPSLEFWKTGDRDASDHSFSMAPRHPIEADWDFYNYCNYSQVMENDTERLKEYFLLPGHLFRWIKEYNETAPDDSWIWSWYVLCVRGAGITDNDRCSLFTSPVSSFIKVSWWV